jgi:hypothetical protein
MPEIIDTADLGEILRDRETLSSGLDSAPQKSINLAQIFKNVFNSCKTAALCNQYQYPSYKYVSVSKRLIIYGYSNVIFCILLVRFCRSFISSRRFIALQLIVAVSRH